jgi:diacylglycerol kinase (ATP)
MKAKVILNPYASRWKAQERLPEAEVALKTAGVDYEITVSKHAGHGIDLAAEAAEAGFNPIIAAGGDSTYNEVVNGLTKFAGESPIKTTFGILPMGTANDLAANLGIPEDLQAAAQIIAAGKTKMMDVCQVNERYFVNNSAIGMETAISVIQMNMKRVHGVFRYLLATLVGIARNPQWHMQLEWDNGKYQGPVTLVSVGNNPRTGGVFYTVPHADPFDGKLSFIYGSAPTRLQIIRLLPRMFKPGEGNIAESEVIHEIHATWLHVHTEPGSPVHSDGEVFNMNIQDLEFKVHPAKLPILIP